MAMKMIKDKFEKLKFLERAKECPFKQFFEVSSLQFFSIIIHQLLLRKIISMSKNELPFKIYGKYLRFIIGEFALITGWTSIKFPDTDVPHNTRLVSTHLNDNTTIGYYTWKT